MRLLAEAALFLNFKITDVSYLIHVKQPDSPKSQAVFLIHLFTSFHSLGILANLLSKNYPIIQNEHA